MYTSGVLVSLVFELQWLVGTVAAYLHHSVHSQIVPNWHDGDKTSTIGHGDYPSRRQGRALSISMCQIECHFLGVASSYCMDDRSSALIYHPSKSYLPNAPVPSMGFSFNGSNRELEKFPDAPLDMPIAPSPPPDAGMRSLDHCMFSSSVWTRWTDQFTR